MPAYVKTGFSFRSQEMRRLNEDRQWAPVGAAAGSLASLVDTDRVQTSFEDLYGHQIPYIDAADIVTDIANNPARWKDDLYYATTRRYIGNDKVKEDVSAGYVQGQVVIGKLKAVAGRALRAHQGGDRGLCVFIDPDHHRAKDG